MARKLCKRDNRYLARLVTGNKAPCAFCLREVDDEITYGKLYAIGDIQCHYFCCLLSCCLIQNGPEEEGLFGFMYSDILAEIERCKKHKCSYCSRNGANLGCCVGACRKQFHLPCGREKNAISLYYGSYKSFCQQHAPKQKIPEHIMSKAKIRMKVDRMIKNVKEPYKIGPKSAFMDVKQDCGVSTEQVCVICYEAVDGFPTIHTFWPPCCAKDAWFHRSCLQRMALSAGMHYLKCPLCNDKENFYEAVVSQGYYVPDRDAAWELEQNAFAEIYERPLSCCADDCLCPLGRGHDAENGNWDIKLCLLCGSAGAHAQCLSNQSQAENGEFDQSQTRMESNKLSADQSQRATEGNTLSLDQLQPPTENTLSLDQSQQATEDALSMDQSQKATDDALSLRYVCRSCLPAAPEDLSALASSIEAIIQQEQAEAVSNARRPLMPSRMSLRRTKGRNALNNAPSSSRSNNFTKAVNENSESPNVRSSRQQLNLKPPRKPSYNEPAIYRDDNKLLSPVKLLEQSFKEKVVCTGVRDAVLDETVIETLRKRFRKPRPLCEKKKIVNDILDGLFDSLMKDVPKQKEQIKEWCSPKKSYETMEDSKELQTGISDTSEVLEIFIENKENNSNASNTPTKATSSMKTEDHSSFSNNDVNSQNNNVNLYERNNENTPTKNIKENLRNRINSASKAITNHNKPTNNEIEDTATRKHKEDCRITRNSVSKTIINDGKQIEKNIQETPTRNIEENRRITRNSSSETNINDDRHTENDVEETPTVNIKENSRITRNSSSETNINDDRQTENDVEETPTVNIKENRRITRNSSSETNINDDRHTENDVEETPTVNIKENRRITRNSSSETNINDDRHTENDVEETPTVNIKENRRITRNSVSKTKVNDDTETKKESEETTTRTETIINDDRLTENECVETTTKTETIKNDDRLTENGCVETTTKTVTIINEDRLTENESEETSTRYRQENCRITRNSLSKAVVNNDSQTEEEIEEPTRKCTENCRITRNSASKAVIHVSNSVTAVDTSIDKFINAFEKRRIGESSKPAKTIKKVSPNGKGRTKKNTQKSPKNVKKLSKQILSTVDIQTAVKGVDNTAIKNDINQDLSRKSTEQKMHTETKISSLKPKGGLLKKLLLEKDLCSQLLAELTTGKIKDEVSVNNKTYKVGMETLNDSNQPQNGLNVSLSSLNNPNELNVTSKTLISTQKSSTKTLISLLEPSNNVLQRPQSSMEAPKNICPKMDAPISLETPKCKTIDIKQDSSLEISENDQSISIDVIKIDECCGDAYKNLKVNLPDKIKTCSFKFSPVDKETLEKKDIGIDIESFKKEYLNEVDREFKCNFRHKHVEKDSDEPKLRTAIDFAKNAALEKEMGTESVASRKRKFSEGGVRLIFDENVKKRKISEGDLKLSHFDENNELNFTNIFDSKSVENKEVKKVRSEKGKRKMSKTKDKRKAKKNKRSDKSVKKNIEVTIDSSEKRSGKNKKIKNKIKTKFAIQNQDIHVKIKWKKKQLSLNIESKKQAVKEKDQNCSKFKQYVLHFPGGSSKEILVKPEKEVCPIKRKYVKQEKSPDKLKQTSIQNFFKVKPEN